MLNIPIYTFIGTKMIRFLRISQRMVKFPLRSVLKVNVFLFEMETRAKTRRLFRENPNELLSWLPSSQGLLLYGKLQALRAHSSQVSSQSVLFCVQLGRIAQLNFNLFLLLN